MSNSSQTGSEKKANSQPLLEISFDKKIEEEDMFDHNSNPPTTSKMASLFCWLAVPAVMTNFMGFLAPLANSIFAGRMNDPTKLAVVGLSNAILMLMIQSLLVGLNTA